MSFEYLKHKGVIKNIETGPLGTTLFGKQTQNNKTKTPTHSHSFNLL